MKRWIVILFILFAQGSIFAQNPTAVIREMTGIVEIKPAHSSVWEPASVGDTVEKATVISTGFRSTVILAVGSSTLTVRPLTRLSLEELLILDETETVNLNLSTGRIRVDVNPPAGGRANFTVQTPSVTASVRGTSFEMDTVSVQVLTGAVSVVSAVVPAARPVTVNAGQETWVDTDTGSVLTPMAAAEITNTLPALPGQGAGTISETGSQPETTGSINIGVAPGGQITIGLEPTPVFK